LVLGVAQRAAHRFAVRQIDPVRQWKLSPTDLAALDRWEDYTEAKEAMFIHTDTADAPWTVVKSNDKKRARLEAMRLVLSRFDYDGKDHDVVGQPDPRIVGRGVDLFEPTVSTATGAISGSDGPSWLGQAWVSPRLMGRHRPAAGLRRDAYRSRKKLLG
jgi:hypothetical protein